LRVSPAVASGCDTDSDVNVSFSKATLTFATGFDLVDQQILT
jgi:hypothetical protein